ncbi:GNAT family N-acetyltransferase [Ammoniphilus sp. 3BR4]|uniref:GNAT family N-acetyltransferase n=1 Tax=Ammoniphilus sp. 3BR4 TaxID=3158265 RepID=UPI003466EC57
MIRPVDVIEFMTFRHSLQPWNTLLGVNDQGLLEAMEDSIKSGEKIYGAFLHGQLAGIIDCSEEVFKTTENVPVRELLIGTIFVHPAFRDKGIGKELVEYVVNQAKTEYVITDPIDAKAEEFFRHCGFIPNEIFEMDDGGSWMMVKEVHPT